MIERMADKSVSWQQATQYRLAKQYLLKPAASREAADVVASVCGVQAQLGTAAELAIAGRVRNISQDGLRSEIWEKRSLVKTYGPRGTLHLLPAAELSTWMAAMRAREAQHDPDRPVGGGFTARQAHSVSATIGQALDGRMLNREQLAKEVGKKEGKWAEEGLKHGWGVLLGPAAYFGLLCFGPSEGAKVTYVRADRWIKNWKMLDEAEALREVARRYVGAYGPVKPQDFSRWFWVSKETAFRTFEEISDEFEQVEFERKPHWILKGTRFPTRSTNDQIFLLPQYDAYTIGCVPRERLILEEGRRRILSHGRGRFESATGLPIFLVNGQVAGIWERKVLGKKIGIKVEPFIKLNSAQKDKVEKQARRFADFFGVALAFDFGRLI